MYSYLMQYLLLLLVVVCLFLTVAWRRALSRGSRRQRDRMRRAQAGEEAAEILLEELGYTIVSRQESRSWPIVVDGEQFDAKVRADLVVTRDDETWIAEVKTGDTAPNPLHPATRRQLLEYLFVFDPDGILLVDVEMGDVMEVAFPVG